MIGLMFQQKKKRKKEGKKERAQNDEVCGGHNQ